MKEFFLDQNPSYQFQLFQPLHLFLIFFTLFILLLIGKNKKKIYKLNENTKKIIKNIILIILFSNMTIYYLSKIVYNVYDITNNLPLHFCFISGYLFMITYTFKLDKLMDFIIFFVFIGPIPAIIYPDLLSTFDSFVFYQYIISHHFFMIGGLFLYYAYYRELNKKHLKTSLILTFIILLITNIINKILGSNYIFSNTYPQHMLDLYPSLSLFNPTIMVPLLGILMINLIYFILNLSFFKLVLEPAKLK